MSGALRDLVALGMLAVATAVSADRGTNYEEYTGAAAMASAGAERPSAVDQSTIDIAYGAFQRGHYLTALNEATKRAQQNDPAAMTLLGEIYAQGLGVGRDDAKAAQWYKLAAAQGRSRRLVRAGNVQFPGPRRHTRPCRSRAAA